jgi:DNA repair protein RecO (recombination protein O)
MSESLKGLVLSMHRYGENSAIVRVFTRSYGLRAYASNGIQGKKSKAGFFQPGNLLDLVVHHDEKKEVNRIKEVSKCRVYANIHRDFKKTSIVLFICELLSKVLREGHTDEVLFDFAEAALIYFDECGEVQANFHIIFCFLLMKYLGFGTSDRAVFYRYAGQQNLHDDELNAFTEFCLKGSFEEYYPSNRILRKQILDLCMNYLSYHVENFSRPKSLEVLAAMFAERS